MPAARPLIAIVSAVAAAAIGCSDPTAPHSAVDVSVAAPEYALELDGATTVTYSVRNAGPFEVLLTTRCGDRLMPSIQRRQDGEWLQYGGGLCLASADMSPVPLSPGATRTEAVQLDARGEYRITIGTDRGLAMSPAFVVR